MTLYKQIVIGIISLFILLISSVFIIEFNTTRNNLEQQQYLSINNTINTIGLALAPYLKDNDTVAVESVINALFDGGNYSRVELIFLKSNRKILRQYPIKPNHVPTWFTSLHLFHPIKEQRTLTSGWMQLAKIEIISQPSEAYQQLWAALTRFLIVFIGVFMFGLIAIALIIQHALKPLQSITEKMHDVAHNQFGHPLARPNTRDLVGLVDGINTMSKQIERTFIAQAKHANDLRYKAYMDPVSTLGNRTYFLNQLNNWGTDGGYGIIGLLHLTFIEHTYQTLGYQAGDKQIRELAHLLKTTIQVSNASFARMTEAEIGFLFENMEEDDVDNIATAIIDCVTAFTALPFRQAGRPSHLGLVYSETSKTSSQCLSLLDNALAIAKTSREQLYGYISSEEHTIALGKRQWQSLVEEAMNNNSISFHYQTAADEHHHHILHKEVFSIIDIQGHQYRANQYLFALEQLNISHLFDEYVIQTIAEQLSLQQLSGIIAINIAPGSITNPEFIYWLRTLLQKNAELAHQLHFELSESSFINTPHHARAFCETVRQQGACFGVDNFGSHFDSLAYLNQFHPSYVKLDYLFTHHLDNDAQRATLLSIAQTAHDLNIITVASRVETPEQLNFLSQHGIDMFQGFIVDRPKSDSDNLN